MSLLARKSTPFYSGIFDGIESKFHIIASEIHLKMANAWETDEDIERHSAGDNKAGLAYKNPLAQQEPGDAAGRLKMDCGDVYYIAVTSLLQQFSVVKAGETLLLESLA